MTAAREQPAIRILFVEDHRMLREGTRPLLEQAPDLVVVGEAEQAGEAVRLGRQLRPDVVLLDLFLAGESSGLDVARCLLRTDPHPAILVLTGVEDMELARAAFQLGIRGYLFKTIRMADLASAIRRVHAGAIVLDPKVEAALATPPAPAKTAGALTERERTVLHLLGQGNTNARIAKTLVLSERTVEWHVEHLKKKLELPSRAALFAFATRSCDDAGEGNRRDMPAER